MKKKLLSMMLIAVFLASTVSIVASATTKPMSLFNGKEAICGTSMVDSEAYLRKYGDMEPDTGNPWTVMVMDDYLGIDYPQEFELVLEGEHCYIWIGLNYTYGDYYNETDGTYHFFNNITEEEIVTIQNLTYLMEEFDTNIYPTDTSVFGMPLDRPGIPPEYNGSKIHILIFNIRDWSFYDPEAWWYIAGYFSASANLVYNRNIIHIDTYQWWNRLGPDVDRPFLVEGVIAHEFQHLIHSDQDSDEYLWIDEGCADFAGFLCGYGHPQGHIAYYLVFHWWTPLTIWTGGLWDYGASYLFMLYMWEHYGGTSFIEALVAEEANGIEGVNNVLEEMGHEKTFDEIFQGWMIANYLDDTTFADGVYGYDTLDIPSADTRGWSIELGLSYFWEIPPYKKYPVEGPDPQGWIYGYFMPYTAHYIRFVGGQPILKIHFDGAEIAGVHPYSGDYEWHSYWGNWLWNRLNQTFTIPETGATLKFWTYYEIETDWDYGYVEVHDLGTAGEPLDEWYTLPGNRTIDYVAHPQDNPNVPEGFEPMDYEAAGKWNALTGFSGGWYQEVMDLTPFANHTIELYFTYWTDGAWMEAGCFIDDIEIPELGFFDNVEVGLDGWTADPETGWRRTTGLVDNDFTANFAQVVKFRGFRFVQIKQMHIDDATQEGTSYLFPFSRTLNVMIVANQPGFETLYSTTYTYEATRFNRALW